MALQNPIGCAVCDAEQTARLEALSTWLDAAAAGRVDPCPAEAARLADSALSWQTTRRHAGGGEP
jgi:hypothetical protein